MGSGKDHRRVDLPDAPPPAKRFVTLIEDAIADDDWEDVDDIVERIERECADAEAPFPQTVARDIGDLLREHRRCSALRRVCDAFESSGQTDPRLARLKAQSLIDLDLHDEAEPVLHTQLARTDVGDEAPELRGLLGRIAKDRYVRAALRDEAPDPANLQTALQAYGQFFSDEKTDPIWHGINVVALQRRAERDRLESNENTPGSSPADIDKIASTLLGRIENTPRSEQNDWDKATAVEAAVALDDPDATRRWAKRLLSGNPGYFVLNSLVRQLEEVWGLDVTDPAHGVTLSVLQAGKLAANNGSLLLDLPALRNLITHAPDTAGLEANFGQARAEKVSWMHNGLRWASGVARIETQGPSGDWLTVGTGFLVPGNALSPKWSPELLLITNYHVINEQGRRPGRRPSRARVAFNDVAIPHSPQGIYEVQRVVWESSIAGFDERPPTSVDICVLQLVGGAQIDWEPPLAPQGQPPVPCKNERLYVVGHPSGGDLHIALYDNRIIESDQTLLHYRSHTESGNSGSPLFNKQWQLVGVHHAGRGIHPVTEKRTYLRGIADPAVRRHANEGFTLKSIREHIAKTST
ncbi:MAG: TRAFs-binding domain-containing protein [Deltaproteobacteria bacterium]|nr:TRAFs-binding domain-containing protein [Deltaproteobacteria bacterium]